MPTEPSAEDRFVVAMRNLRDRGEGWSNDDDVRVAVEAFADAVCSINHDLRKCVGTDDEPHAACRARLLARVMEGDELA